MSKKELLPQKLLESVTEFGIITGAGGWEKKINDLKYDVINDYLEEIIIVLITQ